MAKDDVIFENLKSWMLKNHWQPICDLEPHNFESTGRGLMTHNRIAVNQVILKIPKSLLITTSTVSQSPISRLFSRDKRYTAQTVIAAFLIYERHLKGDSFWKPYLDSLPGSYANPEFLGKSEKELLPAFIASELDCTKKKLSAAYSSLVESIRVLKNPSCDHCEQSLFKVLSYRSFLWAYYAVNTRSIYLSDPHTIREINIQGEDNLAMAPLLDLFNHECETVALAEFSGVSQSYRIKALRSYEPGQQVFINYGSHANHKLYLEYGFFVPGNPADEIHFDLSDVQKLWEVSSNKATLAFIMRSSGSMAFTGEGLNYNARNALFLLTCASSTDEALLKRKIYRDEFTTEDSILLHQLAVRVLRNIKGEYESSLKRMARIANRRRSPSFTVSIGFVEECLRVMDKSLTVLFKNCS